MDINEANKQLLQKRKLNKPKETLSPLEKIAQQCLINAKNTNLTTKKTSDNDYSSLFNRMYIPTRFKKAKLTDFGFTDVILTKYFHTNIFKRALSFGRGIVLCGSYGKGKTHFAYAFAKEYIKAWANEERTDSKTPVVLDYVEIQMNLHEDKRLDFVDKCIKANLLIIDDFMSIDFTPWELSQLTHIINKRYNAMNPSVYTSNLNPTELGEKCGSRLWERIKSVNYVKEVSGKSMRAKYDEFDLGKLGV